MFYYHGYIPIDVTPVRILMEEIIGNETDLDLEHACNSRITSSPLCGPSKNIFFFTSFACNSQFRRWWDGQTFGEYVLG
jgi:hypothetical protein